MDATVAERLEDGQRASNQQGVLQFRKYIVFFVFDRMENIVAMSLYFSFAREFRSCQRLCFVT